jgi:uncharacterized protein
MKLHLDPVGGLYLFTAHGDSHVDINDRRFEGNIVLLPQRIVEHWTQARFETLAEEDFTTLAGLGADVLLLGTGSRLRFPPGRLLRPIAEAGVGLEVMDLAAACRTYNILAAEGRQVAAALLFD